MAHGSHKKGVFAFGLWVIVCQPLALIDYISVPEIGINCLSFDDLAQHRCSSLHIFRERESSMGY